MHRTLQALAHLLRRPAGRHCLDRPQPGQLPALELVDPDPDCDEMHHLEDLLAPQLLELDRVVRTPTARMPAVEWPYNLRSA